MVEVDLSSAEPVLEGTVLVQFTAKKFVLHAVFERAAHVVPNKDLVPVLKNFQVRVGPDSLHVSATDLEMSVVASTSMVSVVTPGTFFVPADKFLKTLQEGPEGDVRIQVSETEVFIRMSPTFWFIRREDAKTYPNLPDGSSLEFTDLDRAELLSALKTVQYAASQDAGRASLAMVHIENGRMTACDGVRLQQIAFPDLKAEVDIPIGAVSDLVKLLRSADSASIGLAETSTHLVFSIGSDLFLINRLMTQFPDMETNILGPALANTQVLEVSRELLASAIRRVRITADSGSNAVNLVLSMDNIRVEAQDGNGNRCFEDVAASWMMGERTVTVNHRSLSDLLSASTAVVCRFKLGADKGTIKSPLLLVDETTQAYGVLQQMRSSFSGRI